MDSPSSVDRSNIRTLFSSGTVRPRTLKLGTHVGSWLVVLRFNVPVNNFSVMSGRSHRFRGK